MPNRHNIKVDRDVDGLRDTVLRMAAHAEAILEKIGPTDATVVIDLEWNEGSAASLRVGTEYRPAAISGLALQASLTAEGNRVVLPYDESVRIPGWTRLDLGASWQQRLDATTLVWRVVDDNATNRQAWKESPYQFGHVYLYPLAPRTWRTSVQAGF